MGAKIFCLLLAIGLLLATSCATIPRTPITPNDLALFKGQWEGLRTMQWVSREQKGDFTVLEVYNDTLPLKGKLVIHFMGTDIRSFDFENGGIDSDGNLVLILSDNIKTVLSLFKEPSRMKFYGSYYHRLNPGTLVLYKK
jgi:hypothetical protein